jgi:hypothetical protein
MIPLNEFLAFIEDAVSRFPEPVDWFENDADLEARVRGDGAVTPMRIVVNTLRIPPEIVSSILLRISGTDAKTSRIVTAVSYSAMVTRSGYKPEDPSKAGGRWIRRAGIRAGTSRQLRETRQACSSRVQVRHVVKRDAPRSCSSVRSMRYPSRFMS